MTSANPGKNHYICMLLNHKDVFQMKKIYLIIIAVALSFAAFAQNQTHLTFKGVPIDGTRKTFVSNMQQKGFTLLGTQEDVTLLSGDFAGYKNCTLGVTTLKNKDVVSTIGVIFPTCKDWATVENNYSNLKSMLSEKYGEPARSVEEFQNRTPRDDNDKYYELSMNRCNYASLFEVENGSIELMIAHETLSGAYVLLRYIDKINGNVVRQAAMDDL